MPGSCAKSEIYKGEIISPNFEENLLVAPAILDFRVGICVGDSISVIHVFGPINQHIHD